MDSFAAARRRMVDHQLRRHGIRDGRLLGAMEDVPRERFVSADQVPFACDDRALPIESGQTISQPWVVAVMLELLALRPDDSVLEVGSGSGYVLALLARLAGRVYGIEHHRGLADRAAACLDALGVDAELLLSDGTLGWPERAPFDAIIVSAAASAVPPALLEQLAPGGRLVMPVGSSPENQRLLTVERHEDGTFPKRSFNRVRFLQPPASAGFRRQWIHPTHGD